jgi:hypothetical protein
VNETPITDPEIKDSTDSGVSQGDALSKVIDNYSTCKAIRNQLIQLQIAITNNNQIISKTK